MSTENNTNITTADLIKVARLKLRIASRNGELAYEDLYDLNLIKLNSVAVELYEKIQKLGTMSFIDENVRDTEHLGLKLELVKFVIATKRAENAAARDRAARDQERATLLELRETKKLDGLKGLSEAEIDARLAALDATASERV